MILSEKPVFPEGQREITEECKNFIEQLLNKDHLKRLGAAKDDNLEIRKHPWLASIDFEKLLRYELAAPIVPEVQDALDVENFNSKYTSERKNSNKIGPKMTMLNEDIVKELAKYDDLFNGFSYNDIIPEKHEDEEEKEEENGATLNPQENIGQIEENKSVSSSSDSEEDVAKLEQKLKLEHQGELSPQKESGIGQESPKSKGIMEGDDSNLKPPSLEKEAVTIQPGENQAQENHELNAKVVPTETITDKEGESLQTEKSEQ